MRYDGKAMTGLALIFAGAALFTGTRIWEKAEEKTQVPVDMPLSMAARNFSTGQFQINRDDEYLVSISAERTMPLERLDCLLGFDFLPDHCNRADSVINSTWVLSVNGKEVARGSSDDEREAGWSDRVSHAIGHFTAKRGQLCTLDVRFLKDISPLASTRPHLVVWELPPFDNAFPGLVSYAAKLVAGIGMLVGVLLIGFQPVKRICCVRRQKRS